MTTQVKFWEYYEAVKRKDVPGHFIPAAPSILGVVSACVVNKKTFNPMYNEEGGTILLPSSSSPYCAPSKI